MSGAPATRLPQREVQQNLQTVEARDGFFSGWLDGSCLCVVDHGMTCKTCFTRPICTNNTKILPGFETKLARPLSLGAHQLQEHPRGLNDEHSGVGVEKVESNPGNPMILDRGALCSKVGPSKSSMKAEAMSNSINSIEVAATQSCGCARLGGVKAMLF